LSQNIRSVGLHIEVVSEWAGTVMPGPIPALAAGMTKEKHASGSSGDLLPPSPPAEEATALALAAQELLNSLPCVFFKELGASIIIFFTVRPLAHAVQKPRNTARCASDFIHLAPS
jgi:hypothetical protein